MAVGGFRKVILMIKLLINIHVGADDRDRDKIINGRYEDVVGKRRYLSCLTLAGRLISHFRFSHYRVSAKDRYVH